MRELDTNELRSCELSEFKISREGNIVIVDVINHIFYKRFNRQYRDSIYNETWLPQHTDSDLKTIRVHMSLINYQ